MDENNFLVCSRITHSTPNIFKRELCSIHHAQDLFFCYESKATTDLLARAGFSSRVVAAFFRSILFERNLTGNSLLGTYSFL